MTSSGGRRRRRWSPPRVASPQELGSAVVRGIGNGWRWLLGKPERVTALSTLAIFAATAVAVGIAIAQWAALKSTDAATHKAAEAAADANRIAKEILQSSRRARISIINLTAR